MSFFLRKTGIVMATSLVCFSQSRWGYTNTCGTCGPCGCQNQWVNNANDAQNTNMSSVCYNACSEYPTNICPGCGQGTLSDGWNSIQAVSSHTNTACNLYIGEDINLTSASNLNEMFLGSGSSLVIASFTNSSSGGNTSPNPSAVVVNGSGYTGYAIYIGGGSLLYLGNDASDQIGYQGCNFSSNASSIIFRGTMATWGSSTNSQTANTWGLGATPTLYFNNGAVAGYNDNFQMFSNITINATGTVHLGGVISQPVSSVYPTFNGTFNLSGANTFYSECIVNNAGGTLTVSGSSPLGMPTGSGTTTLNIATLQMSSANLSIPFTLTSASASTVPIIDLIGTNTLSGLITFGAGSGLNITNSTSSSVASLTFTGSLSLSTALITVASGATLSTPGITVSNLNVQLGGVYNVTQNQTVGALGVASTSTTDSSGSIVLSNLTALTISGTTNNTFAGVISSASLATSTSVNITGSQTFSGVNTFIGNWNVLSGGTLAMGSATNPLGTQTIVLNSGGTLNGPSAGATISNTLNLPSSGSVTMSNLTISGPITIPSTVGSSGVSISGAVTLNPSVLTIATGSLFKTQGQNITVVTFGSGSGTLGMGSNGTDTLTILATSPTTFSGVIADNGTSTNSIGAVLIGSAGLGAGTSTVTLSGNNTFTGGLTLTSGTLSISAATQLGNGSIIGNGGTLGNSTSSTITITNPWTFNVQGAGTTTTTFGGSSLTGSLALTGAFTVSFGSGVTSGTVSLATASGTTLTLTPSSLTIPSGAIFATNGNNITVGSGGLQGVSGGVLSLGVSSKTDTLTITGSSNFAGNIVDAGTPSGAIGAVVATGANPLTLTGANTFSGGLTLNASNTAIYFSAANNVGTGPITMIGPSNLIAQASGVNLTNSFVLSGANVFTADFITTSSISGSGSIALQGYNGSLGTLTITGTSTYSGSIGNGSYPTPLGIAAVVIQAGSSGGNNNIVTFNGSTASTFTGGLTLQSGTLSISNVGNLGSATPAITANGGALANSTGTLITITNPWTFSAQGTTTTTTTFGGPLTLTGAFSVVLGSSNPGTASMATLLGASLTLAPSSLSIAAGATFATNGTSITVGSGGLSGSGTLSLGANGASTPDTLTIQGTSSFSGIISNSGAGSGLGAVVINASSNTVTLSGANTFTGGLTLQSGTLSISSAGNTGAVGSNFSTSNPITFSGGTLSSSAASAFTYNTMTFTGGVTATFAGAGSFSASGPFYVAGSGAASIVNSSASLALTPASLTMAGGSTLAITGANSSFSCIGPIVITGSSGTSSITVAGLGSSLTPSSLTIATGTTFSTVNTNISVPSFGSGSGTLSLGTGTLTIPAGNSSTFSGVVAGSGGVVVQGQVGFFGANTFTGGLTLSTATTGSSSLTIQAANGVGSSGNTITGNGGTLITSGTSSISLSNPWIFNAGTTAINTTLSVGSNAPLTLTGTITVTGTGTAEISATGSGNLTLIPSSLTIPTGATLQINGNNQASSNISTPSLSSGGTLQLGGVQTGALTGTLTITGPSTYSGNISDNPNGGNGAVTINSSGLVTFSGTTPSTFTGGLTLTAGTLAISNFANVGGTASSSGVISAGGMITGNGGTLQIGTSNIQLQNPWTFNVATTTTFTVGSGATLLLTGPFSVSSPALGTATIAKTSGGGTLSLMPSSLTIPSGSTLATNGNSMTVGGFGSCSSSGCGTLSLGSATVLDTLTIVAAANTTFSGNIVNGGAAGGAVVINSPSTTVNFTGTTASTFSNGLTLTAGTLTITAANQVGTGTITGNGGSLTSSTPILTLTNNVVLNSGTTTTFIFPNITVNGGGSGISGSGGLALGGILTIQDGSTYSGIISDASTTDTGSVVIDAGVNTVTFEGVSPSTFTGGITLTSGILQIASSVNLGSSATVITGNGGTLQTNVITSGSTITNSWNFVNGKTTTFNIEDSAVTLTGVFSVATGTSTIIKTGAGTLNLNPSSLNIVTNSTLQITNTNLNIGSASFAGNFGACAGNQGTCAGTLSLTNSTLVVASNAKTLITFGGNVVGTGSVVIEANVSFFGQNTFSGGLTLAPSLVSGVSSLLTITPSLGAPNQIGTGTITGSGGALATTATFTVPNSLNLTGGVTSTFTTTQSGATLTFAGAIATVGTGTATISTSGSKGSVFFGTAAVPIQTLTVITNTTLATNGNSIVMGTFGSGSGTISLGATGTQDTLTIAGGTSTFSGVISEAASGNGIVNVNSTGTVTFSGANTFSGGLTLTGGTLSITSIGNLGLIGAAASGIGSITPGNAVTFSGGTLSSVSAILMTYNPITFTGGSSSTFTGGGSFTLDGTFSVVGVQGTTATIATSGGTTLTLSPSSLTIAANTTLATNGNSMTLGSGGFACAVGATCTGTLSLGLISGTSSNIDTLTITTQSNTSFAGNITNSSGGGIGAVNMNLGSANNTLTLTGVNTFSGGLTLTSGSLAITAANQVGTGTITGSGGSLVVGSGTAFTMNNLWTLTSGDTTAIEVNNTGSGNNTAITYLTLSNVISGSGALTATGSGVLVLSGANTYSGNTTVNSGTLTIDGSLSPTTGAFTTTVNGGATLTVGGAGSIGATLYSLSFPGNVANSGAITGVGIIYGTVTLDSHGATNTCVVKPGNSIGTLTVVGHVNFTPTTSYIAELNASESSKLIVIGTMDIAEDTNIIILPSKGPYVGVSTHQIADVSGGFTGRFAHTLTVPGVFLDTLISYENDRLILATITALSISGGSGSSGGLAKGSNAVAVASAIDNVITYNRANVEWSFVPGEGFVFDIPPQIPLVIESLRSFITSSEEMTNALNQMHPALFKGMTIVQQNNAVEVREALTNRMQNELDNEHCFVIRSNEEEKAHNCKKDKRSLQVWANGIGNVLAQDSSTIHSNPEIGYQSKMAGVVLGIDKRFAKHYYVGALGGYTSSHVHFKQGKGAGDVNSGYAGIYASALGKMFYGNASATVGWNEFSAKRNIIYPGVNLTAKNDHLGTQLLSHLDTGVNIGFKGITLRPFDSFDYVAQRENSYTETNAGEWNLHVKKANAILIRNELGLQFAGCVCFKSSKWTVAPKLSWVREVRVKGNSFVAEFAGTDSTFEVVGYYPDRSLISPGVVVSGLMLNDRLTLGAYYNGEFKGGYSSHNYGGEARFGF